MGKTKKKNEKGPIPQAPLESSPQREDRPNPGSIAPESVDVTHPAPASGTEFIPLPPQSRFRRLLPDFVKVALAFAVIGLAVAIWIKPPLIRTSHPYVSYLFGGQTATDAKLYRPLAMPTRYYIEMPRPIADRYTWFAVDRRREVAALAEEPQHRFFGKRAIKRSDPLGLDLEFRKLDNSEWQVHFFDNAIVFSNALLSVRIDIDNDNSNNGK